MKTMNMMTNMKMMRIVSKKLMRRMRTTMIITRRV